MTGFATMTSKNQVTLPADLVAYAQLKAGMRFWIRRIDKKVVLEPVQGLRELQGMLTDQPLSAKYTTDQIITLARKRKMTRLYGSKNG